MTKLYEDGMVISFTLLNDLLLFSQNKANICVHLKNVPLFFPQWKKHWFVLTDQSLRYYKDSIAEEVKLYIPDTLYNGI